jgi:ribosomal protein S4
MATVGDIVTVVEELRRKNRANASLGEQDFTREQLKIILRLGDVVKNQLGIYANQVRDARYQSSEISDSAFKLLQMLERHLDTSTKEERFAKSLLQTKS